MLISCADGRKTAENTLQFSHYIFLFSYADLDEKVLMQASLQHTFSFKSAHG